MRARHGALQENVEEEIQSACSCGMNCGSLSGESCPYSVKLRHGDTVTLEEGRNRNCENFSVYIEQLRRCSRHGLLVWFRSSGEGFGHKYHWYFQGLRCGGGLLIRRFGMISDDLGWSFQDLIDVLFLKKTRWVWSHFWSLHRMAAEQKTCLHCYSRIALLQRLCYKALRSRFTSKVANWCKLQIWQCGASPPCCKRSPARGRAWKHILYTFCPQDLASSFGLQVCCEQAVHNLRPKSLNATT